MKNKINILLAAVALHAGVASAASLPPGGENVAGLHFSGTVIDAATHKPLEGVRIAAGTFTALTDSAGRFRCEAPSPGSTVTATRPGYVAGTVSLRGDTILNISLFTTAFRPVMSSDAFTTASTELSLDDVLAGRAGGSVRAVSRSGNAAVGSNLFIRGINTLNSNSQPLIVVDGTIWDSQNMISTLFDGYTENPLADIDVNDIESVQVLRDATSIYGSKGSNGAILITTRRSHSFVTRIDVDVTHGFNFKPRTYDMMNAADFRSYLSEVTKGSRGAGQAATTYRTWMTMDPASADYPTYHNNTDWTKEVFRTGNTQHYGITIDGSDDVASYAITLGYTGNDATEKSVDFSRLNMRINGDVNLLRNLSVGVRLMYSYLSRNLQDDGTGASASSGAGVGSTSPTFLSAVKSPFLVPYAYTDDGSQLTSTLNDVDVLGVSNPVALIENAKNTDKHYRFALSVAPVWKIDGMLTLDGRFSYQLVNTREHYFSPMTGVSSVTVYGNKWQNTVKDQSMTQNSTYADVNLRFGHDFGLSRVEAHIGGRTTHSSLKYTYADGHNTGNDDVSNLNNSLSWRQLDGADTDWSSVALVASASYTYDSRYTVYGTLVEEASSRFGKKAAGSFRMMGGTWGTFPSVGVEWNLGNETFMRRAKAVSSASLHAGYGVTGNDDLDGMGRFSYLKAVPYLGNATGLEIGSLANEEQKWETTRKLTAGFNLGLLGDRLSLSLDWFHHTTSDLLNYRKADIATGQAYVLYNSGKLENNGFEAGFEARPVVLRGFSWMTNLSFMHYKNKIKELPEGDYTTDILGGQVLTAVGRPAAVFYGYKTSGVFATQADAVAASLRVQNSDASYSTFSAGDVRFVDTDGNGVIDDGDRQVIGDPNPDVTGTFFNRLTWRRLTLDVLCGFSLGNDVYNYQRQLLEGMSGNWNQTNAMRNRWKMDGQLTDVPKAAYGDPMGNSRFSDRWIEDGSFFKVRSVKLSYEIPIRNTYVRGLTVWTAGENLLTLTKYLGVDPEVSMSGSVLCQGVDNGLLAVGRAFYMGVKINL